MIPRTCARASVALRNQVRTSIWNFQDLVESEIPDYHGRPNRTGAALEEAKRSLPKITFMTSCEFDALTKSRSNIMGEYTNQRDLRQKVTELMLAEAPGALGGIHAEPEAKQAAELQALQRLSEYAGDLLEHQHQNVQRVNDFVESNPVFTLEQPLREEARWNTMAQMDSVTRASVRTALRNWLPTEYRQVKAADIQQKAAFSTTVRQSMLAKVDEQAKAFEKEIASRPAGEQAALREILKADVAASKNFIDPTHDITADAIAKCTDASALRDMAHRVHQYNGDERMAAIYVRAAELTKDAAGSAIAKELKAALY
eukprot:NODE_3866_length_1152_cov_76.270165_g3679_i0.p1 GENE.NODE_3866_length_1152_cov_76.270165_g3679_i0~~NODE_3866_length_1152_cov_76.270165_g3679_i0.p1  ORF type:complete len:315 (+),score=92.54 NODE_3866_length_1152_cov_76.270165_g3679_i0:56-1000(+)